MYALSHGVFAHYQCGNYASANAVLDELAALAEQKGTLFWKAFGIMNQGCVRALTGQPSDAIRMITSGWQSTGATMWMPFFLSYLARAHAELGKFEDAWCSIGEAMKTVETSKERWCEAEVHRTAGEITLLAPDPNATRAKEYFERALAVARAQRAKSWELRAAMSIARLWRAQNKGDDVCSLLVPIYGWFTEGFATLDLKEAKALLHEFAS
jgi:predicted ATPase